MTDPRLERNKRKRDVRPRVVRLKTLQRDPSLVARAEPRRLPLTRGDCADVPRPCPYVSCKYNLYLDVSPRGGVKLNFPDLEPHELPAESSCALDVAGRGGVNLETVAEIMNITRERARQIEIVAFERLRDAPGAVALEEYHGESTGPGRGEGVPQVRKRAAPKAPAGIETVALPVPEDLRETELELGLPGAFCGPRPSVIYPPRDVDRPQLWELRVDADVQSMRMAVLQ